MKKPEALLDSNLLIALLDEDHEFHRAAGTAFSRLKSYATCPITQGALLRHLTRPRKVAGTLHPPRCTPAEAAAVLEALTARPEHQFIPDNLDYAEVPTDRLMGFRQWTDAYLLALARRHGTRLLSTDADAAALDDPGDPALWLVRPSG